MKIDLSGKTALATDSTEGIGFATAKTLSKAEASVILHGRNVDEVTTRADALGAGGSPQTSERRKAARS